MCTIYNTIVSVPRPHPKGGDCTERNFAVTAHVNTVSESANVVDFSNRKAIRNVAKATDLFLPGTYTYLSPAPLQA